MKTTKTVQSKFTNKRKTKYCSLTFEKIRLGKNNGHKKQLAVTESII